MMHLFLIHPLLILNSMIVICDGFRSVVGVPYPNRVHDTPNSTLSDKIRNPFMFHSTDQYSRSLLPTASALFSKANGDENGDDEIRSETNDAPDQDNAKSVTTILSDGISLLSSFSIQFFGVAFALGLLLNICGFGYTFDLERGLHIDRVENLRREYQFKKAQREIARTSESPSLSIKSLGNYPPK